MKKITLFLLSLLFVAAFSLQAQKQFSGDIRFKMKLEGTDDPNITSSIEALIVDVSILGNKAKTLIKDEQAAIITIWDGDKETTNMVVEINFVGKYFKKWSKEEWKEKSKFKEYKFEYTDEYKTILDYKCQKVVVTITNTEDDSTAEEIVYVTKEIGSNKINGDMPGLDGFPLMTMSPVEEFCDGCYRVLEAIKITPKKLKDLDFFLPSDAKNIDDDPEWKERLKGLFGE
jgi:hypothetical protein